jgi:Cdc6-like AAA superfamily ATPase
MAKGIIKVIKSNSSAFERAFPSDQVIKEMEDNLTPLQKKGVETALDSYQSIINGKAGTGKTYIINIISKKLKDLG